PDTDFPGWYTTGGIPLQQGGLSQGGTIEVGQSGFLGVPAPDGGVFVEMDGNHHDQLVSVTPGQILDWELSHRGRPGTDEITISAGPLGNLSVLAVVSSPNTEWIRHSGQYTVPTGVTQILFRITPSGAANGDIDSSNLLDDVKLCPAGQVITCATPGNIALGKTATQSSTYTSNINFDAGNALDGDNNGVASANSMSHTLNEANAWWEVDLGESYELSAIKIWNRTDCCSGRLSDFHVLVSDDPFASSDLTATINQSGVTDLHFPGTAGRETDLTLSQTARYVRIQLAGQNFLQLAEVEIIGCTPEDDPDPPVCTPVNLSAGKSTSQSSTRSNRYASAKAVDGDTNGDDAANSLSRTRFNDNAWWELDLGDVYELSSIKIWNRTDCCSQRLKDFHVLVSEVPFNSTDLALTIAQSGVEDLYHPDTASQETDFTLSRSGRYVRVQLSNRNSLTLAEVEVMGCPINAPSRLASQETDILIFPNPAFAKLNIDLAHYAQTAVRYTVHSLNGQVVAQGNFAVNHQSQEVLDVSSFANGMYIIRFQTDDGRSVSKRFIVSDRR
ncbi:MAG: discoidin domain-containing protein, partial [Bacteroidota bacterium]